MKNLLAIAILVLVAGCNKNELVETNNNTQNMAKVISAYGAFTAGAIKARAAIPNQGDMTVAGTDVSAVEITTTKIKNVLGESSTAVGTLCTSGLVNKWSGFGPRELYVSGGVLTDRVKTPYAMGNFAGYDPTALTPGWYNLTAAQADIWIASGGTATFIADIITGQINYANITNVHGIALTIWDGTSLVAVGINDLATIGDISSLQATLAGITAAKTYTGKIYLVDNTATFLQSLGNAICKIPNVSDFTVSVKLLAATSLVVSASGWTVTNAGINLANSTVSFTAASSGASIANLLVQVRLVRQTDGSEEDTVYYAGAYTANTNLGAISKVVHSSVPIPAYGYTAYLEFFESE